MKILKFPEWQRLCEVAFSERDRAKVPERVAAAELAIFRRLQELKAGQETVELQTIDATLQRLRLLIVHLGSNSNAEDRLLTMPARNLHNGLIFNGIKRHPRPVSSGGDQPR
jgi:hypothetical protein